ncbi:MAG: DUF4159 domain-containing protein [Acidobacteria bacterium]|nr:DUF4159 domain-containing protein [Acidobacteriota bacterium]
MLKKSVLIAMLAIAVGGVVYAQRENWQIQRLYSDLASNRQPPTSTEFVIARIQFTSHGPGRGRFGDHRVEGWAHDYPSAEENILQVAREATGINLNKDSYVIVRLDSDELFRYPFALMSEVGEMTLTPKEAVHLREYLNRGGFIIVDDFDGDSLEWFANQMKMVFPDRTFVELTLDHPIFHTLYDIKTLNIEPPYPQRGDPKFYGYLDEHGRVSIILNHNNDIGDFWEWIDEPRYPLPPSTEGLRLGLDYILYSLTH